MNVSLWQYHFHFLRFANTKFDSYFITKYTALPFCQQLQKYLASDVLKIVVKLQPQQRRSTRYSYRYYVRSQHFHGLLRILSAFSIHLRVIYQVNVKPCGMITSVAKDYQWSRSHTAHMQACCMQLNKVCQPTVCKRVLHVATLTLETIVQPKQLHWLTVSQLSLNIGWLVTHSLYLSHLREIAT